MQAITCRHYGPPDALKLEDIPTPSYGDDEVLVRVNAASINSYDWRLMVADPFLVRLFFGLFKPKYPVPGADLAGTVVEVGKNVTRFKPGEEVFGDISECGNGAFAEYATAREEALALKPDGVTFEEAAAAPFAGMTALQALRDKTGVKEGQKVLINGASGGVGSFAVQIAKAFGAEVTGVCSTRHLEMVHSIGADHVIDYTREDFTKSGQQYDLIVATGGSRSIWDYKRSLLTDGTYVMVGGSSAQMRQAMFLGPLISMTGNQKMSDFLMRPKQKDLVVVKELMESGKIKSVIDRRFPLRELPDAMRYFDEGHPGGKIVVTM
jgi:NADPH:quinone reductase-like Zn-dependent oxidoreductase